MYTLQDDEKSIQLFIPDSRLRISDKKIINNVAKNIIKNSSNDSNEHKSEHKTSGKLNNKDSIYKSHSKILLDI